MYFELLKNSIKQSLVYRANVFINFLTSFLYLFVTVNIWKALYRGVSQMDDISFTQMLTYVLITQVLVSFKGMQVSNFFAMRIRKGDISLDFIKPYDLKYYSIFVTAGEVLFKIVVYSLPMLFLGILLWGFQFPKEGWQWLCFIISASLGAVIYTLIEYVMGLTIFWFKTGFHVQWIMNALFTLFSGSKVPLWFYPDWLKVIADYLPFRFIVFEQANIFAGDVTFGYAITVMIIQIFWIMVLSLIGRIVWHYAQRVITVQGG